MDPTLNSTLRVADARPPHSPATTLTAHPETRAAGTQPTLLRSRRSSP